MAGRCGWVTVLACVTALGAFASAALVEFEDLELADESYWNGADGAGGFVSGGARFGNIFTDWGGGITSWEGFAYSNRTDVASTGPAGQYTAIAGGGQSGSVYAVAYVGWSSVPTVTFDRARRLDGLHVGNNAYAYHTMQDGDAMFGIEPFAAGDWFRLTITGRDAAGAATGRVETYLADLRAGGDGLLDAWRYVDLSGLGAVASLEFGLASSDVGPWGMNTPAYFVLDTIVPEPASVLLLALGAAMAARRRGRIL